MAVGYKLKVDEQGVQLLNNMADGTEEGADSIVEQTDALLEEVEQYPALGPHKQSIISIVNRIQEDTKGAATPARVVAEKLRKKAKEYQEWIDDDLFGGQGN